jgi:hypothetical protein
MDKFLGSPKRLYTTSRGGYVTLIGVLVVGAVGMAVAVSVLLLGLGSARTSFAGEQSAQARAFADACAEEALQVIHDSLLCTPADDEILFEEGSCTSVVTSGGLFACTIDATGTVGNIVRRTQVELSSVGAVITVSSWKEVSDF